MNRTTARSRALFRCLLAAVFLPAPGLPVTAGEFDHLKGRPTNQASKRDNGSCGVFTGKVALVNIFFSDPESDFKRSDRREVRRRTKQTLKFIQGEAAKYDQTLQFEQTWKSAALLESIPTRLGADPAWTQRAISLAMGEAPNDVVGRLRRERAADHVLFVLHVNKSARSHNLSYYDSVDPAYHAERVVCYLRYEDDRPTAVGSYVHELLHAFGAGELYFPYDETDTRKQLASQLFPKDIMYRVEYRLRDLEVGDYTAYRIGWLDALPDRYHVFQDPD